MNTAPIESYNFSQAVSSSCLGGVFLAIIGSLIIKMLLRKLYEIDRTFSEIARIILLVYLVLLLVGQGVVYFLITIGASMEIFMAVAFLNVAIHIFSYGVGFGLLIKDDAEIPLGILKGTLLSFLMFIIIFAIGCTCSGILFGVFFLI